VVCHRFTRFCLEKVLVVCWSGPWLRLDRCTYKEVSSLLRALAPTRHSLETMSERSTDTTPYPSPPPSHRKQRPQASAIQLTRHERKLRRRNCNAISAAKFITSQDQPTKSSWRWFPELTRARDIIPFSSEPDCEVSTSSLQICEEKDDGLPPLDEVLRQLHLRYPRKCQVVFPKRAAVPSLSRDRDGFINPFKEYPDVGPFDYQKYYKLLDEVLTGQIDQKVAAPNEYGIGSII
jgi:hypothetical protein